MSYFSQYSYESELSELSFLVKLKEKARRAANIGGTKIISLLNNDSFDSLYVSSPMKAIDGADKRRQRE